MKKILLLFLTCFVAFNVKANVDSVFIKPNEKLEFELKVDTLKFPVLKGNEDQVKWYQLNSKGSSEELKTIEEKDGKKYFKIDKVNTSNSGKYFYSFTLKVDTKSTEYSYSDTVKFVHVYSNPKVSIELNNIEKLKDKLYCFEGDTINFTLSTENLLDINKIIVFNDKDTLINSNTLENFIFIPKELGIYNIEVSNPYKKVNLASINYVPKYRLDYLEYTYAHENYTSTSKIYKDEVDIHVINEDKLSCKVNTNASIISSVYPTTFKYTWNKEGKELPKGITVINNTITIDKYNKETMDGSYNCIVSNNRNEVFTVTFNITSDWKVANEIINIKPDFSVSNNIISIKGNHNILITNILGQIIENSFIDCDSEFILDSGLYIIKIDNKSYKINIK